MKDGFLAPEVLEERLYADLTQEELRTLLNKVAATTDDDVMWQVLNELEQAQKNYPPMHSAHEGFAVIQEEMCELWDEVKKKPSARSIVDMRYEALQVAAMAMRFVIDVCNEKKP